MKPGANLESRVDFFVFAASLLCVVVMYWFRVLWIAVSVCFLCALAAHIFLQVDTTERQVKFDGLVSGAIASLALNDVCFDYTSEEIWRLAQRELERCRSMKRPPEPGSDPFWSALVSSPFEFALLCAKKYAAESNDKDLLNYCDLHLIHAERLTASIGNPWR